MNDQVTRRTMLGQSLASLFVLGELQLSPAAAAAEPAEDLHLAAAATLEFFLQKMARPTAHLGEFVKPTPALKQEAYEISHLLKPWNAPQIFQRSELRIVGDEMLVIFSPDVAVRLRPSTIAWLKPFARPWWQKPEEEVTLTQVFDCVQFWLIRFSQDSSWLDD
jgi:hypothetical protein